MPQPVQYLAQTCYASVPGWCCGVGCLRSRLGTTATAAFVVRVTIAAYAGAWAVPVCNVYYNRDSHFYTKYGKVAKTVRIDRSIALGEWPRRPVAASAATGARRLAHDRLLHQGQQNLLGPRRRQQPESHGQPRRGGS